MTTAIKTTDKLLNTTVIITALGYMVDVYDMLIFNVVRRPSLEALGVTGDALTTVGLNIINLQLLGLIIGGFLFGILGDKLGRKKCLLGSILLYSVATLLCAFVQDVSHYAALRFFAGIGLAGEIGIGVSLITENMSKEKRGLGVTIFAFVGIAGAVIAGFVSEVFDWRTCYMIGGIAGLLLLITRSMLMESGLFEVCKNSNVKRGNVLTLIQKPRLGITFLACALIGVPIYFIIGVPWTLAPEIGTAMNMMLPVKASLAISIGYTGMMCGDLIAGYLSYKIRSRKKVIGLFLLLTALSIALFLNMKEPSQFVYYAFCGWLGIVGGYWVNLITIAAEQFGTNLRATVATSVPNITRASLLPMNLLIGALKPSLGIMTACWIVGGLAIAIAFIALTQIRETYGEDMNYHS